MKVLIVSGFLGAGKTSFIRHMTDTLLDVDFVIFENEIGETDIDVKVLQEGERSLNVYEMTENCVCCTGKADFLTNLMTILFALDPEVSSSSPQERLDSASSWQPSKGFSMTPSTSCLP